MSIYKPDTCIRGHATCDPLARIESTCGSSFTCCGLNDGSNRVLEQDKYTICFKNSKIDTEEHWDRIDLVDQLSILSQALSVETHLEDNLNAGQN